MINYYLLTKPGILIGNLMTFSAGFLLASKGHIDFLLFLQTFIGLTCIMASACVFNNYLDRKIDRKMNRTKGRVLANGLISQSKVILFGAFLGILGLVVLMASTNPLTVFLASFGFFVYIFLYTLVKSRTVYGTIIGSIAGAIPPVVGYCAVSQHLDLGALLLFLMMIFWQMPHFFSIAIIHLEDYMRAEIPLLPVKKGIYQTKIHMLLYICAFLFTAFMLNAWNYAGNFYLIAVLAMSSLWLFFSIKGFFVRNDKQWSRKMFRLSLLVVTTMSLMIAFDLMA